MNMLHVKLLRNAIDILKRDGWLTGDLHEYSGAEDIRQRGAHCAMGAIIQAADELKEGDKVYKSLGSAKERAFMALAKIIDPNLYIFEDEDGSPTTYDAEDTIAEYNDGEAEGMSDVIEKMRAAVSAIKQGELAV